METTHIRISTENREKLIKLAGKLQQDGVCFDIESKGKGNKLHKVSDDDVLNWLFNRIGYETMFPPTTTEIEQSLTNTPGGNA